MAGDRQATRAELRALEAGERASQRPVSEKPPPERGVDRGLVDIDDRDN